MADSKDDEIKKWNNIYSESSSNFIKNEVSKDYFKDMILSLPQVSEDSFTEKSNRRGLIKIKQGMDEMLGANAEVIRADEVSHMKNLASKASASFRSAVNESLSVSKKAKEERDTLHFETMAKSAMDISSWSVSLLRDDRAKNKPPHSRLNPDFMWGVLLKRIRSHIGNSEIEDLLLLQDNCESIITELYADFKKCIGLVRLTKNSPYTLIGCFEEVSIMCGHSVNIKHAISDINLIIESEIKKRMSANHE